MSGYAHIHRSLLGHPAFRNDAEAMAFAWMILRASWKPVRVRYKGKAISLERGQLAISVRDLADAMDRDKAWIERLFKRLKSETMIETHVETGVSVVTICNYAQYQASQDADETARETPDEIDARHTQDTEQEDKKITSEPKGSSEKETVRAKSDFPCPPNVDPSHWRDFMANRRRKKCVNSPTAYAGVLRCLAEYADDEWPPGRLVHRSAEQGWAKIVNPHEDKFNGSQKHSGNHQPAKRASSFDAILAARRNLGAG